MACLFLFHHQQTGIDLAELQASSSNRLYGVSVFHFCLSTICVIYHILIFTQTWGFWPPKTRHEQKKQQHPLLLTDTNGILARL